MKKIGAVVLLICLFIASALADVKIDSLSDLELVKLYEDAGIELAKRGISKSTFLSAGIYTVATSIPYGLYKVALANSQDYSLSVYLEDADGEVIGGYSYTKDDANYILVELNESVAQVQMYEQSIWIKVDSLF